MLFRYLLPILAMFIYPAFAAEPPIEDGAIRIATFNAYLNRSRPGQLINDLEGGKDRQAAAVAEIIQRVRPDVLVLQEIDRDEEGASLRLFQEQYLAAGQEGAAPITYEHHYFPASNTGVPSGFDLDNDGATDGPGDSFGFGDFEGQYAFAILSRFSIDTAALRSFQTMLWRDLPDASLPSDPETGRAYYTSEELEILRLSSKNHVVVPIDADGFRLHVLASHPTPPVFDGQEDRNGLRNRDEIRFWSLFLDPEAAQSLTDDQGIAGGLPEDGSAVLMGDFNADPLDGDSTDAPIALLMESDRLATGTAPVSEGGAEAAAQGGANRQHQGDPAADTSDFRDDGGPGNLRVDYVLPTSDLRVVQSGVFWPDTGDPLRRLVGDGWPVVSSDHRLVYADVIKPAE